MSRCQESTRVKRVDNNQFIKRINSCQESTTGTVKNQQNGGGGGSRIASKIFDVRNAFLKSHE